MVAAASCLMLFFELVLLAVTVDMIAKRERKKIEQENTGINRSCNCYCCNRRNSRVDSAFSKAVI